MLEPTQLRKLVEAGFKREDIIDVYKYRDEQMQKYIKYREAGDKEKAGRAFHATAIINGVMKRMGIHEYGYGKVEGRREREKEREAKQSSAESKEGKD